MLTQTITPSPLLVKKKKSSRHSNLQAESVLMTLDFLEEIDLGGAMLLRRLCRCLNASCSSSSIFSGTSSLTCWPVDMTPPEPWLFLVADVITSVRPVHGAHVVRGGGTWQSSKWVQWWGRHLQLTTSTGNTAQPCSSASSSIFWSTCSRIQVHLLTRLNQQWLAELGRGALQLGRFTDSRLL